MDRNHENTRSRAIAHNALAAAQKAALETEQRRQRSMLCAWGSVTAMALVATLGLAEGCAHDHTRVSSEVSRLSRLRLVRNPISNAKRVTLSRPTTRSWSGCPA